MEFWRKHGKLIIVLLVLAIGVTLLIVKGIIPNANSNAIAQELFQDTNHDGSVWADDGISRETLILKNVEGNQAATVKVNSHFGDLTSNTDYIPEEYKFKKTNQIRYVVLIAERYGSAGEYNNGAGAFRTVFDIQIIDRTNGSVLGSETFEGAEPPKYADNKGGYGPDPDKSDVSQWVEKTLNGK